MASKRMFTMKIVDSDAFLDMPLSTQCLYFHLNMRADDDGFIGNAKRIARLVGASDDDLKLLIAKRFVLQFDDGVIVVKHWRMHNTLSSGRYHETQYLDEKSMLKIKDNGSYSLTEGDTIDDSRQIEMGQRQVRRTIDEQKTDSDKDIGLVLDKVLEEEKEIKVKKKDKEVYFVDDALNDAFLDYIDFRKKIKAPLTDRAKQLAINKLKELAAIPFSESIDDDLAIRILEQSIMNGWKGLFPLKEDKKKEANQGSRVSMWQDIMEGLEDE